MASTGLTSLLWFAAIVVMIPAALWLLKRTPMGGGAAQGVMRTVAMLPLSQNQRIVTLEVGQGDARQWLVLGVTAQNITTLHTMAAQSEPPAMGLPVPPFAQLFNKLRRDQGAAQ